MASEIEVRIKQDFINLKPQSALPPTGAEGIIFLNELDNLPKYREPQNGKVYDLMTERYIGKNCQYQENRDKNGLFAWMYSDFGNNNSINVSSLVSLEASSILPDYSYSSLYDITINQPGTLPFVTDNLPYSYIYITLKTKQLIQLSGIYIESPSISDYGFLQSYSVNILNPTYNELSTVAQFTDDFRLVGENQAVYIPIENVDYKTSVIYLTQMGLNSAGTNNLALGQIELYGKFI